MSASGNQIKQDLADHWSTRDNYDRLSRWYDLIAGSSESRFWKMGIQKLDFQKGMQILEIGSGTGKALLALAEKSFPEGKVFGLDISMGMQLVAAKRITESGYQTRILQINSDALLPPFPPDTFNIILLSFTLELFKQKEMESLLALCHQLLVPDGQLCIISMADQEKPSLMLRLYHWAHHKFPGVIDCRPINASKFISQMGFKISSYQQAYTWGLPVDIVLARN